MTKFIHRTGWIVVLLAAVAGCESSGDGQGTMADTETLADVLKKSSQPPATASSSNNDVVASDRGAAGDAAAAAARADESALPPGSKPASERPPLKSNPRTYWGAIASANRNIRTRLDDLPWKKSVQLFQAEKGYKPRDTKEFLERVRGEGTPLPEIPQGFAYLYLPDEGQFGELYQVPLDQMPGQQPEAER